jgi:hypothetical protein
MAVLLDLTLKLLRISEAGLHDITQWLDEVLHPIEEAVRVELGGDPSSDKNGRPKVIDPIVENLNVEAVLNEHSTTLAHVIRVEE